VLAPPDWYAAAPMTGGVRGIVAGLLGALVVAAPAGAADYRLTSSWALDDPSSVAVDGESVFVVSTSSNSVTRYAPSGKRETSWSGDLRRPSAVALGPDGRVHVADDDRRVEIFDRDGNRTGGGGLVGPDGGALLPWDLDVGANGELYVAHYGSDAGGGPGVVRYSAANQGLAAWGSMGGGDGQFTGSLGIAVDDSGSVYVVDKAANRVQRFGTDGAYLGQWGQIGRSPGEFVDPTGVAVDGGGDVYVADQVNGRVQRFDRSGRVRAVIDLQRRAVSSDPVDVDVDPRGRVYIADDGNPQRMYVFSPTSARCAKAERRVARARKSLRRLRSRDAGARKIASAKRKLRKAKQRRRAAC
jgi:tripartite motif-containing protein 71